MDREKTRQMVEVGSERCLQLGSFVLGRLPVVGPGLRHFLDQDGLLSRLLHHEGVKHFEQVTAELEVAKACGPEEEAVELGREATLLAAEVFHAPETGAEVLPFKPGSPDEER